MVGGGLERLDDVCKAGAVAPKGRLQSWSPHRCRKTAILEPWQSCRLTSQNANEGKAGAVAPKGRLQSSSLGSPAGWLARVLTRVRPELWPLKEDCNPQALAVLQAGWPEC